MSCEKMYSQFSEYLKKCDKQMNRQLKNQIGTFCEPKMIVIDPIFLQTLDKKEIYSAISRAQGEMTQAHFELVSIYLYEGYLTFKDKIFGGHRSHSHIISLGVDLKSFFAEILVFAPHFLFEHRW